MESMGVGVIGIVGGVGPYAGIDLQRKIAGQTLARQDQEHLPVISLSQPGAIADRSLFLLGQSQENPAPALLAQLCRLEQMGATVAGIPCNTAHAPAIFDAVRAGLAVAGSRLTLLHMIAEVARFLPEHVPQVRVVGLLATAGTYRAAIYPLCLGQAGIQVVLPPESVQQAVHRAIFHPAHGLKACGQPTPESRRAIEGGIEQLRQQGAHAVILGCTELPLAVPERAWHGLPIIDPALILARALIRAVEPARLRPWEA